jgi:hypothetical protein
MPPDISSTVDGHLDQVLLRHEHLRWTATLKAGFGVHEGGSLLEGATSVG